MKILISGSFWHGSLEESYARAFENIGWKVIRFDWEQIARAHPLALMSLTDKLLRHRIADRVGKWMINAIRDTNPNLVLVIKGRAISPDTVRQAKQVLGDLLIINFNPDSPWDDANKSARLLSSIPEYDAHFTWNRKLIDRFQNAGAKQIHYLPFAYDPVIHHPLKELSTTATYDAVFVGTYSEERDELLGSLTQCDIRIVGNGWSRARVVPKSRILSDAKYGDDALSVLSSGVCAINILRPQNIGSHNMRTFEIPASAMPMLTSRSEEQLQMFAEGSEMECFDGAGELSEKILALRQDRKHAQMIAQNGYERVQTENYAKRATQMLEMLGFSGGKG